MQTESTRVADVTSGLYSGCPACAGGRLHGLWQVNDFQIAKCLDCSLVFVQNRLTPQVLVKYYESGGQDDVYLDPTNAECLAYYYRELKKLVLARCSQPGRILDVGCATGGFLDEMAGWECHGIELQVHDAELARKKYGERIFTGTFEDYPSSPDYFDVITLQDVFDHMIDPIAALEKCRSILRPGGLIVIKVHDISCLYAKATGKSFYAIIPPFHLFYYNRKTLALVLQRTGFKPLLFRHIAHLLKLKTIFWRLSKGKQEASIHYRIYQRLKTTRLGELKIRKNLHDVITVLAAKS